MVILAVSQRVAAAIKALVAELGARPDGLSADGCTQMLFDFQFATDVLVGPPTEPSLRARVQSTEALLKVRFLLSCRLQFTFSSGLTLLGHRVTSTHLTLRPWLGRLARAARARMAGRPYFSAFAPRCIPSRRTRGPSF